MGCAGKEEVDILSGLVCIAISQGVRGARPQINMGLLERTMREIDSASQKINTAQWWRRWWRRWYYTLTAQKWDSQLLHCWEGPHGALNTAITDAREHLRQLIPDEAESDRGLPSPNAHLFRSANVNVNGGNMINIVVINVDVRSSESASN
ncbi:hypothetical protein AX16_007327 [Volvariella volvacea WC 439]|nr:hypothetical protein AX16_007327 [Volvariella volvacea WC 439]